MKILVADDNAVARSVLRAFLAQAGFEPVVVDDGEAALKAMQTDDPPPIAILDWMMPGISGLEVCTRLRAVSPALRPYIIMLTARSSKADVASGLDSGADEFITKPFNQIEMMARLRVARRMVEYEQELKNRIEEMTALLERHKLLGDMVVPHSETTPPIPVDASQSDAPVQHPQQSLHIPSPVEPPAQTHAPRTSEAVQGDNPSGPDLTIEHWARAIKQTFASLNWPEPGIESEIVNTPYVRPQLISWAGFFVEPGQDWFDLLLGIEQPTLETLFVNAMKRQPGSDRVVIDYFAETVNLIANDIKYTLEKRDFSVTSPFLSRGSRTTNLSRALPIAPGPRQYFRIQIGDKPAELTVIRRPCPVKKKSAGQLNIGDILAEAFQPSEDYNIPLLNRGTVLSERFIERLVAMAKDDRKVLHLPVFERAPLAAHFAPTRTGKTLAGEE